MVKTKTVLKDTPLAEITLRRYEKPYDLSDRELVKRIMLSIGLLQPGDSRDVIVDVFNVILKSDIGMDLSDVEKRVIGERKEKKLPMIGIASSNIRRQVRRLKELFLVEKFQNKYRITENLDLYELFEEKIEKIYINSIVSRVKEYFKAVSGKKD